jgi:hypothetical protein
MTTAAVRRPYPANETARAKKVDNPVARFRPGELKKLMAVRYGRKLPPNDDGARFRDRMLDTLAMSGKDGRRQAASFLAFRCPLMTAAARADAIEAAFKARRYWSPEALGNDLNVTAAEHAKARIRTFRVAGMTDADMKAKRNAEGAARKRQERQQKRLHPKPKPSRPALRATIILNILMRPGEWVGVPAICAELKRTKAIHFGGLNGGALTAAVHRAIELGIKKGTIEKRVLPGAKAKLAQIRKRGT